VQLPESWRPVAHLPLRLSGPNTAILLLSSVAVWWGERAVRRNARGQALVGVGIGTLLGLAFLAIQIQEWHGLPFALTDGAYGSIFYTVTGFHMAHVAIGVVALALVWLWTALGYFDPQRDSPVTIVSFYWHFVDAVWLCVWFTFYLSPYLS
jgi:heme/copper-type cytochrome/quinol oxidase subunit 3